MYKKISFNIWYTRYIEGLQFCHAYFPNVYYFNSKMNLNFISVNIITFTYY
jgi:hypothetical protein